MYKIRPKKYPRFVGGKHRKQWFKTWIGNYLLPRNWRDDPPYVECNSEKQLHQYMTKFHRRETNG